MDGAGTAVLTQAGPLVASSRRHDRGCCCLSFVPQGVPVQGHPPPQLHCGRPVQGKESLPV